MAIPSIKATYTIDVETKRALDELAKRWEVSRSEALRRAVRQASGTSAASSRLAAFEALQQRVTLSRVQAERWATRQRSDRRRASLRSESKWS